MSFLGKIHARLVYPRRVQVLASSLAEFLPPDAEVLDVGCGDGVIDSLIMQRRPDVSISGIDVLMRDHMYIPATAFDGQTIPYSTGRFDAVIFIDVLHHTDNPEILLREAMRVSREVIVIKDHIKEGRLAGLTLKLMDWVGNAHHGVVLKYNYWTELQWREMFAALDLAVQEWNAQIGLYPVPATWLFERSLHFIAKLVRPRLSCA
jgi:SAM-dependent methyltransferase